MRSHTSKPTKYKRPYLRLKVAQEKTQELKNNFQSNAQVSCKFGNFWTTSCFWSVNFWKIVITISHNSKIKITETGKLIFPSIQHCAHLSWKWEQDCGGSAYPYLYVQVRMCKKLCIIGSFAFYIQLSLLIVAYIFLLLSCSVYVITNIDEKEDYEPPSLLLQPRQ